MELVWDKLAVEATQDDVHAMLHAEHEAHGRVIKGEPEGLRLTSARVLAARQELIEACEEEINAHETQKEDGIVGLRAATPDAPVDPGEPDQASGLRKGSGL